jgi:hypothetical protein
VQSRLGEYEKELRRRVKILSPRRGRVPRYIQMKRTLSDPRDADDRLDGEPRLLPLAAR